MIPPRLWSLTAMTVLGIALGCVACSALAQTWLAVSVTSYHLDRGKYNETNPGLGVEQQLTERWRAVAGAYRNSLARDSAYAGVTYTPWRLGEVQVGTAAALITGYGRRPCPALFPVLSLEGKDVGMNLIVLAPHGGFRGGVGLQVKLKLE